jgi:hypothetical protein
LPAQGLTGRKEQVTITKKLILTGVQADRCLDSAEGD